jgi:hypothetical protein
MDNVTGLTLLRATHLSIKLLKSSGDGVFYPSTQRQYRRLILLLILLHISVVRPSSGRNILLGRITQLTTDPLFLEYS